MNTTKIMGFFFYRRSWVKKLAGIAEKNLAGMARANMVFYSRSWVSFPGNKTFPSYLMGIKGMEKRVNVGKKWGKTWVDGFPGKIVFLDIFVWFPLTKQRNV